MKALAFRRVLLAVPVAAAAAVVMAGPSRADHTSCHEARNFISVGSTTIPVATVDPNDNEDGPISGPIHNANDGPVTDPGDRPVHQANCAVIVPLEASIPPAVHDTVLRIEAYPDDLREWVSCVQGNAGPAVATACPVPPPPA